MRVNVTRTSDREVNIRVSEEPVCHIQSHGVVNKEVLEQMIHSTCAGSIIEDKTKDPEYKLEGWMGHGLCFSPRADSHRCDVCGKPTKTRPDRTVGWMDLARPDGDHRRYAHAECLEAIHKRAELWPKGTYYRTIRPSAERKRQWEAIEKMRARGMSVQDAWRLCMWQDGKPSPNIEREFDPVYNPEVGDVVRYNGCLYIVSEVRKNSTIIKISSLNPNSQVTITIWSGKVELAARGPVTMRAGVKYA